MGGLSGAASYSIYLVHTIFVGFAARVIFKIPAAHACRIPPVSSRRHIAIVAGCAAYRFVETPLQRAVRRTRLRLRNVHIAQSRI